MEIILSLFEIIGFDKDCLIFTLCAMIFILLFCYCAKVLGNIIPDCE